MIYTDLYKVSGSLGRYGREDCYTETEGDALVVAMEFIADYDNMTKGFWSKRPVSGAFVSILHLPSRVYSHRYSQVESRKWIADNTPLTLPPWTRWPRR